jgi:hypothetical protein
LECTIKLKDDGHGGRRKKKESKDKVKEMTLGGGVVNSSKNHTNENLMCGAI